MCATITIQAYSDSVLVSSHTRSTFFVYLFCCCHCHCCHHPHRSCFRNSDETLLIDKTPCCRSSATSRELPPQFHEEMRPLEELYCLTKPKKSRFDGVTSHIPWWHCKHGLIYWQNQLPYTVLFWNVWSNCVYSVWFIATLNTVFISQVRLKPSRSSVNTSTFSKVPLSVRVMEPLTPKKKLISTFPVVKYLWQT